jgi:hypothetical protein
MNLHILKVYKICNSICRPRIDMCGGESVKLLADGC